MLYRGTKPAALYRGAYKPGKLYKGTQLVAGYKDESKAAPASWDGTYDDVVGIAAQGRGKQQTYSGKNLLDDAAMRTYSNWTTAYPSTNAVNRGYKIVETPGQYTLSWAPTSEDAYPEYLYLCVITGGQTASTTYLTTSVIVKRSHTFTLPADSYAYLRMGRTGNEASFETQVGKIATIQLETGSTATAYEPYVGGQPSPSPDYPQPLVAAEGSLTASGRTGTTPSTVTLPTLRAIPGSDIRDDIAYIGGGQWQVTRRVGVVQLTGVESWGIYSSGAGGYARCALDIDPAASGDSIAAAKNTQRWTHYQVETAYTNAQDNIAWLYELSAQGRTFALVRSVAQQTTLADWKAFLAEQAAAGGPVTIWYALATPAIETVTLGELPSCPVHTELAVTGDFPPDVTGTVKVSL